MPNPLLHLLSKLGYWTTKTSERLTAACLSFSPPNAVDSSSTQVENFCNLPSRITSPEEPHYATVLPGKKSEGGWKPSTWSLSELREGLILTGLGAHCRDFPTGVGIDTIVVNGR